MLGGQLIERGHTEEAHGSLDLTSQNFDGAVYARAAAGHEPIEVGPSDESEPGAVRYRSHDVLAMHDATVQMDLDGVTHGSNDRWQKVKRDWRAVELTATMVRQNDGIYSCVGEAAGVV